MENNNNVKRLVGITSWWSWICKKPTIIILSYLMTINLMFALHRLMFEAVYSFCVCRKTSSTGDSGENQTHDFLLTSTSLYECRLVYIYKIVDWISTQVACGLFFTDTWKAPSIQCFIQYVGVRDHGKTIHACPHVRMGPFWKRARPHAIACHCVTFPVFSPQWTWIFPSLPGGTAVTVWQNH